MGALWAAAASLAVLAIPAVGQTPDEMASQGARLRASQARELSAQVSTNPEDLGARLKLIGYYWRHRLPDPWREQVLWMIEHHPDSVLLQARAFWMPPRGADGEVIRTAWVRELDRRLPTLAMIDNAFRALIAGDFTAAENLLERTWARHPIPPLTQRLAELYACALVPSYRNSHMPDPRLVTPEITERIKSALLASQDAPLLDATAGLLGSDPLAKSLRERADFLDPDGHLRREAKAPATRGVSEVPSYVRVPPAQFASLLVKKVVPVCPPDTNCYGAVRFDVVIGKDGRVVNLTYLRGARPLVPAAMAALRQWVYSPVLLNGAPIYAESRVSVRFAPSISSQTR